VGGATLISRREHFPVVGSTNDVVAGWLGEGVAEVCIAVADEQTAGRGRNGRTWTAPAGRALMLSLGFRPSWLDPSRAWQLAAVTSMAMAAAAEAAAALPDRTIRLKWPNDLVVIDGAVPRKLAGVLGETTGLGTADPRAVVGIGVNVGWESPDFPQDLASSMTSLLESSSGRFRDRDALLGAFLPRLESAVAALRNGMFDAGAWVDRQVTTDQLVELHRPDGGSEVVRAIGVDPLSGALIVEGDGGRHLVQSGEIRHLRLAVLAGARV
jgi:BirA family transcriptional regulator, biotin operon repressor / biotin---[acetyl-CoA-carboxylase] ligase